MWNSMKEEDETEKSIRMGSEKKPTPMEFSELFLWNGIREESRVNCQCDWRRFNAIYVIFQLEEEDDEGEI